MHALDGGAAASARTAQAQGAGAKRKASAAAADEEQDAVRHVLAEEVRMVGRGGKGKGGGGADARAAALVWEVKALMAQKELVQQQVIRVVGLGSGVQGDCR